MTRMTREPARRLIFHLDMDAFFASIEQRDRPELRGKPVLVGHDGPRGVVCAASYEARPFGCRSAMPMAEAKRRCPQAQITPVRGPRYRQASEQIFELVRRYSPVIEPLSIDEAFIDLTGCERLHGDPVELARKIKAAIREQTGLTASIGISRNKFLAKLASDLDKPDGLTVIWPEDAPRTLAPLDIHRLWGLGPVAAGRLNQLGVRTIGDLQQRSDAWLERQLGAAGPAFARLARGLDDRPVTPDHDAKSIGQEKTFGDDLSDLDAARSVLLAQIEDVAARLRRHKRYARRLSLKLRHPPFQTLSRSITWEQATDQTQEIWRQARSLFDQWAADEFKRLRLIGVAVSKLTDAPGSGGLFTLDQHVRARELDRTMDAVNQRFGQGAIRRAASAGPQRTGWIDLDED